MQAYARVAESADAPDLGSGAVRRESSSLSVSTNHLSVAQLGSVLDLGSRGHGFKSHHSDQFTNEVIV